MIKTYRKFKCGSDPEYFLWDPEHEVFVSADEHTDNRPNTSGQGQVFADGFQAEVRSNPRRCREGATNYIKECNDAIFEFAESRGLDVVFTPVVDLGQDRVDFLSEYAQQFGCDPSFNAWADGDVLPTPDGEQHPLRYAGGHMHMGALSSPFKPIGRDEKITQRYVKVLDYVVGLPLVKLFHGEAESTRRQAYGRAGTYRMPSHGIEYRVPSNQWLKRPALTGFLFGQARAAMSIVMTGEYEELFDRADEVDVIEAINNADREKAARLWRDIKPILMSRPSENHTSGPYYRAFDILCAVDPGLQDYAAPRNSSFWGALANAVMNDHPNKVATYEHDELYLEPDDFKTAVPA